MPSRSAVLVAGGLGSAAHVLGEQIARRKVTCLFANSCVGLPTLFARAPAMAILIDGSVASDGEALQELDRHWPAAKRIVVGAFPKPGPVPFDIHFPGASKPADAARTAELALRLATGASDAAPALVIDDSRTVRAFAIASLEEAGRPAMEAGTAEAALDLIERFRFSVVLMDLFMAGMGGIEGIQLLRARAPHLAIVAMSGGLNDRMGKDRAVAAAVKIGADHALTKPFQAQDLVAAVAAAMEKAAGRLQAAAG